MRKGLAKYFANSRLSDLAKHCPVRERIPDDLPSFDLPHKVAAEPVLFSIVSPLDEHFIYRPLHIDGAPFMPLLPCCSTRSALV